MQKSKLSKFTERVHNFSFTEFAYEFNKSGFKYGYCVLIGFITLPCKFLLQLDCKFINNNRSNISNISDWAKLFKLPISLMLALYLGLKFAGYKSQNDKSDEPKEFMQVIRSIAFFGDCIIGILIKAKAIHFLVRNNENIINFFSSLSTVLFLFSELISCYYKWKEYWNSNDPKESDECLKKAIFSTVVFLLSLSSNILKRIETAAIPIDLGIGVILNLNLSITVNILLGIIYLKSDVNKFISVSNNGTGPSTELGDTNSARHDNNDLDMGIA